MVIYTENKGKVIYNNSELHFIKIGSGPKYMLAFHGFGLNKHSFVALENRFGSEYTIFSFDLFFHGESYWSHKDRPIEKVELKEIFQDFLAHFSIQKFSIITYSLGGKFGLCVAESFMSQVQNFTLVASDGFVLSPWYVLATNYKTTRSVLKYFVFKPQLYFFISKILNKLKIIPNATIRFAEINMSTVSLRRKVYMCWVVFRHLKVDIHNLCRSLNTNHVKVEFCFGTKDTLIPMHKIIKESRKLDNPTITLLDCSHSKVLLEYAKQSPS